MSRSYFDVIFIGADLAPLTCAALLAKRGFRVLVLGQGDVAPQYRVGPYSLPRRVAGSVGAQSPVMRRILSELGLTQTFKRVASTPATAFQVALPQHRLNISRDAAQFGAELQREFPEVRRPIEDFHRHTEQLSKRLDEALAENMVWPPETLLERRQFGRTRDRVRFAHGSEDADLLAEFPEDHPFRRIALAPAFFEGAVTADSRPTLGSMHLYNNLYMRNVWLEDGLSGLRNLLLDRIRSHSGEVRLEERAAALALKRGRAHGVYLFGSGVQISASFVVCGIDVGSVLRLLPDRNLFEELFERIGEPQLRHYRYTLNLVLQTRGVPQGMERDVYFVGEQGLIAGPEHALHIQRHDMADGKTLLCVETLLSAAQLNSQPEYILTVRGRMRRALRDLVPFMDRHTLLIDSPHDGLPPECMDETITARPEHLGRRGPQTMPATYSFPVTSALNLCALPTRGPVRRLLLCNGQVVPGLGLEGLFLSGSSTARVISKSDRSRAWMRRRHWPKVEF